MNIRTIIFSAVAAVPLLSASAQTPDAADDFDRRYNLLVSKLGPSGVGIETLLDKWESAYPEDIRVYTGRFSYCYSKSQKSSVVPKAQNKYLGEKPLLTLKDSTGKDVNYFQETFFDDELFGQAQKAVEKAIRLAPDRLDLRFLKTASLVGYEKESPDMALSDLKSLAVYDATQHPKWEYPGMKDIDENFFAAAIQEYCYLFFRYASPASYEAFRELSETMLKYDPDNVLFLDNMGSYYLVVKRDDKTALKYYNKVLKIKNDDITAIKNVVIMARNSGNVKLERKYLPLLEKYSDSDSEKLSAKARLDYLNSRK